MQPNPVKALAVLALPVAMLMVSAPGFAEETPQRGNMQARKEQMRQEMGFSAEQSQRIKAIKDQARAENKALAEQMHAKRQALMQYIASPNAQESQARSMQREINALQGRMSEQRISTWFEMRKHLTPEQIQKFSQMRQRKREHSGKPGGREGFGRGRGNPDRPGP